jgi:hypothetical protein
MATEGQKWDALYTELGPDGQALYYFLLNVARDRSSFESRVTAMLPLISTKMSPARFNTIALRLVQHGLLRISSKGSDVAAWTILQKPPGWKPMREPLEDVDGKRFCIPNKGMGRRWKIPAVV